ncbi:ATP-binding protein [Planomonospora sp. ID91781]|uniref:Anti-sigma regulatory factor n=3 Tax=Planomonospora TaxID=1998 RepID=A0A171DCJ1_9ACTN|nr:MULTISPECIES: ATP-binding protein [Planomonospora]MBG0820261.1 ATP-binding protein [Planomonospora sp. ID91781]GAT67981.1 anti-sigma regulatory factor [Planomonospora sphaerica]GGK80217.1 anti-sigma regulatory factor [Planomonospora parontospora]GII11308.1 anti-sigma regulatory factor [Planomonospora parontospora subsp. parontospora]
MATVELTFSALPAHVRTARLVATAIARRTGVEESLLDEVRLAVGEACSRAVEAHRLHCPGEPIRIELCDDSGRFEVIVTDAAPSDELERQERTTPSLEDFLGKIPDTLMSGFGIAVIAGLADDVEVFPSPKGMRIRMSWPAAPNGLSPV